jgi:hypothetical protein
MVMEDREKPSLATRIIGALLFIAGSCAALFWFFYQVVILLSTSQSEVVVFNKGSFYMLGVGVGMSVLAFAAVQEGWVGKVLSKKQADILTRIAVVSLALIFITPNLFHYISEAYFSSEGYSVCDEASSQWLFVRDIVYIQDTIECSAKLKEK